MVMVMVMVNVDLYSAIITKVSNALNVTDHAGWQVTLCDPMWHVTVSSRSGVATLRTAIHLLLTYLP